MQRKHAPDLPIGTCHDASVESIDRNGGAVPPVASYRHDMPLMWDEIERDAGQTVRQCDLNGHFFAELLEDSLTRTWAVRICDYENNLMACAAGLTEVHATNVVERWDREIEQASAEPTPIANAGDRVTIEAGP